MTQAITTKNKQVELRQTRKLLHSKANHRQNEKVTYGMEENICKSCSDKGFISKIYKELIQFNSKSSSNNNNLSKKMGKGPEETFYRRRYMKGQQVHEKMLIGREMQIKPQ